MRTSSRAPHIDSRVSCVISHHRRSSKSDWNRGSRRRVRTKRTPRPSAPTWASASATRVRALYPVLEKKGETRFLFFTPPLELGRERRGVPLPLRVRRRGVRAHDVRDRLGQQLLLRTRRLPALLAASHPRADTLDSLSRERERERETPSLRDTRGKRRTRAQGHPRVFRDTRRPARALRFLKETTLFRRRRASLVPRGGSPRWPITAETSRG